jgi:hypothetical protein
MTTAHSSSLEEHEEDSGSGSSDGAWAGGGDDNDEPSCSPPCAPHRHGSELAGASARTQRVA